MNQLDQIWQPYRVKVLMFFLFWVLFRSYYFFEYNQPDRHLQSIITHNLLEGRGLSLAQADPTDLAKPIFHSFAGWPPGYNLVQLPVYQLTNDYFASMNLVHLLGIILLFGALHLLLFNRVSALTYVLFFASLGISFAPIEYAGTTGLWAAAGLFFSIHHLLVFEQTQRTLNILWAVVGLAFACLFRYAYYPFYLLLPAAVFFWGRNKSSQFKISLLLGGISLLGLILFQQYQSSGQSWFDSRPFYPDDRLIYWSHLTRTDVFPLKAFTYLDPGKLAQILQLPFIWVNIILWTVASGIIIVMILYGKQQGKYRQAFYGLLLLTAFINVGPLVAMSLSIPAEVAGENGRWTYLQESRYFLPVMIIIQIWIWEMAVKWRVKSWQNKMLRILLTLFLLYGAIHTSSRLFEYFGQGEKRKAIGSMTEQQLNRVHSAAKRLKNEGKKLVYIYGNRDSWFATRMAVECAGAWSLPLDQWNGRTDGISDEIVLWLDLSREEAKRFPDRYDRFPLQGFRLEGGLIFEGIFSPE